MENEAPTPRCLTALAKIRSILVALRDKADDQRFVMNKEARIKDICNMLHSLMDTCPDLFDDVMIEWTKGLDVLLDRDRTGPTTTA